MITTEFGRLVAVGGATFAFFFFASYLRLRWQATRAARKARGAVMLEMPLRRTQ